MFDDTGLAWTSVAFFPVLGALVIAALVAIAVGVRAARQGRKRSRDRALVVAGILIALAALWPVLAVLMTPIGPA